MKSKVLAPTPEYMEMMARVQDRVARRNGKGATDRDYRIERAMVKNDDSVLKGLTDEQDKHRAVAAKWPQWYRQQKC